MNDHSDVKGSTFNLEAWDLTEELDSFTNNTISFDGAVPSHSNNLLQYVNSCFSVISLDESHDIKGVFNESHDDVEGQSLVSDILSDHDEDLKTLNLTSHKAMAKKSTGCRPKKSISSKKHTKRKIDPNDASVQQVDFNEVFEPFSPNYDKLEIHCEPKKIKLNEKSSDEINNGSPICKILSVSSIAQSNKGILSNKSKRNKSGDQLLKNNGSLTSNCDVPVYGEHAVISDEFTITAEHDNSLSFVSKGDQTNKCLSVSKSNEIAYQPISGTLNCGEIHLVGIEELLKETVIKDNILEEEFVDVEMPVEMDYRRGKTKEIIKKFCEDKNNRQDIKSRESFHNSKFSPPEAIQSTSILPYKDNNYYNLYNPLNKSNSHTLIKSTYNSGFQNIKAQAKGGKKVGNLSKSFLNIEGTTASSSRRILQQSPKTLSDFVKDSPAVNSNLACDKTIDLEKRQILDKISNVKNLTLSTLLDHLSKDDIKKLGGKIFEGKQTFGFARGLEPETILGIHFEEEKSFFIIKWAGSNLADVVTVEEARAQCPQLVIEFYENQYRKKCSPNVI